MNILLVEPDVWAGLVIDKTEKSSLNVFLLFSLGIVLGNTLTNIRVKTLIKVL